MGKDIVINNIFKSERLLKKKKKKGKFLEVWRIFS